MDQSDTDSFQVILTLIVLGEGGGWQAQPFDAKFGEHSRIRQ